VYIILVIVLCW